MTKAGGMMSMLPCLDAELSKVWVRGEGKVSRTCVSHLERSLLNDLHLFSDL